MIEVNDVRGQGLVSGVTGDDAVRRAFALICAGFIGHGMNTDPEVYREIIARGETDQAFKDMDEKSGCGLTMRGGLARLGVRHARLGTLNGREDTANVPYSYKTGGAIVDLAVVAGSPTKVTEDSLPQMGHICLIGGTAADGGEAHVFCVLKVSDKDENGGFSVSSADGGQSGADSGFHQHIANRVRKIKKVGSQYWETSSNRRLIWFIDPAKLTITDPSQLPDNWLELSDRYLLWTLKLCSSAQAVTWTT